MSGLLLGRSEELLGAFLNLQSEKFLGSGGEVLRSPGTLRRTQEVYFAFGNTQELTTLLNCTARALGVPTLGLWGEGDLRVLALRNLASSVGDSDDLFIISRGFCCQVRNGSHGLSVGRHE